MWGKLLELDLCLGEMLSRCSRLHSEISYVYVNEVSFTTVSRS